MRVQAVPSSQPSLFAFNHVRLAVESFCIYSCFRDCKLRGYAIYGPIHFTQCKAMHCMLAHAQACTFLHLFLICISISYVFYSAILILRTLPINVNAARKTVCKPAPTLCAIIKKSVPISDAIKNLLLLVLIVWRSVHLAFS